MIKLEFLLIAVAFSLCLDQCWFLEPSSPILNVHLDRSKMSRRKREADDGQDKKTVCEMRGSRAYAAVKRWHTWSDAEAYCMENFANGHLVSIVNAEENEYIKDFMKAQSLSNPWIGLKGGKDDLYTWSDGSEFIFDNWKKNKPAKSLDHAAVFFSKGWVDLVDSKKKNFICKADLCSKEVQQPQPEEVCLTHGGKAYTLVMTTKDWMGAEAHCNDLPNGHLTSVHGKQDRNFINNDLIGEYMGERDVWIGFCNTGTNGTYQWSDKTKANTKQWASDEPSGSGDRCTVIRRYGRKRQWASEDTTSEHSFVCRSSVCRDGEMPSDCTTASLFNERYFAIVDEKRNYEESEIICELMGGHLASIHTEAENNFVKQLMQQEGLYSVAIGLNDIMNKGTLMYTDGTPVDYVDWKEEYESIQGKDGTKIQKKDGKFAWVQHSLRTKNYFVCTSFSCPPEVTIPAEGEANNCQHAKRIGDRYFQLVRQEDTYYDAEDTCQKLGGHLASVHNSEEDSQIKYYLKKSGNPSKVRIGGTDRDSEGSWLWTDGTQWDYNGWGAGEPNTKPKDGDSLIYKKDKNAIDKRAWYDYGTRSKLPYLCASESCPEKIKIPEREDICACTCSGDPHCLSFDGRKVNYQGACLYVLAQDNCVDGIPSGNTPNFIVVADQYRKEPFDRPVSWLFEILVILSASGMTVKMTRDRDVFINNAAITTFPYNIETGIEVSKSGRSVRLMAESLGLEVISSGGTLEVLISEKLKGTLCGICGNCDGTTSNDWTIGPNSTCADQYPEGEWPTTGSITDSTVKFGDSWLYDLDPTEPDICTCKPPDADLCTEDQKLSAEEICESLRSPFSAFNDCLKAMPSIFESAVEDCVFDICSSGVTASVCDAGLNAAKACLAEGMAVGGWRAINEECYLECPDNQHYEAAGLTCEPTCGDPTAEGCSGETEVYEEGCFCDESFYREGDICIAECPTLPAPLTTSSPTTAAPITPTSSGPVSSTSALTPEPTSNRG